MTQPIVFASLSILEIFALVMLFASKDILHAVLSLSAAFTTNALMLLVLEQPFLALLQLFIMVGGIATYLVVGVASAGVSRFKHTNYAVLDGLTVASFEVILYGLIKVTIPDTQHNVLSAQAIAAGLSWNITLLYLTVLALFAIGIGAIAMLRRIK